MAFSDNIIKNMANEIIRDCQAKSVSPEYDFVVYIIQLMLYNPKFGNASGIDRRHLENFVEECVRMIVGSETPIYTLKMQHTVDTNYGALTKLVDEHTASIEQCLKPLINEILDADPATEAEYMKLYRKISIFVVLSSGLGNPGAVMTLKEGIAALESVFPAPDLRVFVDLPRPERLGQLQELVELVSGVRLFNRDCGRGGEGIPDLTFTTLDAGRACAAALSSTVAAVTQRVSSLTAAVGVDIDDAGEIVTMGLRSANKRIFDLITFYRQYEVFLRRLLSDVAAITESSAQSAERARVVLQEIHLAVKYKTAVPAATVYPLFRKLWSVWRSLQNIMYLLATVHRLMTSLNSIHDHVKITPDVKKVVGMEMKKAVEGGNLDYGNVTGDIQFQGFCATCLNVGALVPAKRGAGVITCDGKSYGFCSVVMAKRFSLEPRRYINGVLEYARNNIDVINLLRLKDELTRVRNIPDLVAKVEPKIQVVDRHIQTETHPRATHIDKDYSWDMWEWKRRACQWAKIVNCRTRATQTHHSHHRREAPCQTTEPRARAVQTTVEAAVNTDGCGRVGYPLWSVGDKVKQFEVCPCTVSIDSEIDKAAYEIIKKINETSN
ncbi:cilia- and flagella-associated protein 206-like [Aricia agestis]|uniref:cilia- and flagella-associated protein 206-like n=1 Tax=Aricia agestis TaxID=91739 RepID=UPI001C20AB08|nr:cilia- and flagella-associated protein 206-like [Aricia agestis]